MTATACPGCGGAFADVDGPVHRYLISSPGCWAGFGELLAADYASPGRMAFHQLIVDAYAAQHPGSGELHQQVQSVGLHLMTLCLFLENGTDPALGAALHRKMVQRPTWHRLDRSGPGAVTWTHVPLAADADLVREAAHAWAAAVWDTYRDEHPTIRTWLREAGFDCPDR